MSNYRNNGSKPPTSPKRDEPTDGTDELTQPIDNPAGNGTNDASGGMDIIDRIRAKRKREEALKSIPEAKRMKADIPKTGEPTVLIVIHSLGHWELRTDKFICK
jgi:hypothetical protein